MPLITKLAELAAKLPIEAVALVVKIVSDALESDDPKRYLERRAFAEGSRVATEKAVDEALGRLKD